MQSKFSESISWQSGQIVSIPTTDFSSPGNQVHFVEFSAVKCESKATKLAERHTYQIAKGGYPNSTWHKRCWIYDEMVKWQGVMSMSFKNKCPRNKEVPRKRQASVRIVCNIEKYESPTSHFQRWVMLQRRGRIFFVMHFLEKCSTLLAWLLYNSFGGITFCLWI